MIRALLFDLDDTLIDRAGAFRRCLRDLAGAAPRRRALTAAALRRLVVLDRRGAAPRLEVARAIVEELGLELSPQALGAALPGEVATRVMPACASARLLSALSRRYRVAIVTNGAGRTQRTKLERSGLGGLAEVFVSGEVGAEKPDPEIFLRALAWAGCRPDQALFIGDDPERDVAGAARAGLRTAWIALQRRFPPSLPSPNYTLECLSRLPQVLA